MERRLYRAAQVLEGPNIWSIIEICPMSEDSKLKLYLWQQGRRSLE